MGARNKRKFKRETRSVTVFHIRAFAIILLLSFIAYGNSIQNDYNIDDTYVVSLDSGNTLTEKGIRAIPKILFSRYNTGEGATLGYRPMGRVTMAIEHDIWGDDPHAGHFVNVLLFAINAFLVFLFFRQAAGMLGYNNRAVLFIATLFFIVHPIHTEVVCSIKNREEILASIFMLSALMIYLREGPFNWKRGLMMAVMLIFAFWSKETSLVIAGILPLAIVVRSWKQAGRASFSPGFLKGLMTRKNAVGMGLVFVFLLLIYSIIPLNFLPPDDAGNYFEQVPFMFYPASHLFPNGSQTLIFYLQKLTIPHPLGFYYGYDMLPDTGWNSWIPFAGIAIFVFAIVLSYRLIIEREWFLLFWFGFFILAIFPLLNLTPGKFVTGTVAERLVYISSTAFCILFSALIHWCVKAVARITGTTVLIKDEKPFYIVGLAIAAIFLVLTVQRNPDWRDKMTLYSHDIHYLSRSARANSMLASACMKQLQKHPTENKRHDLLRKGKKHFAAALAIYPQYDRAWLDLGNVYLRYYRNIDSAGICFENVITANPRIYSNAREALGDIQFIEFKEVEKAIGFYIQGLNAFPRNKPLYNKLVSIYASRQMNDEVIFIAERASDFGWPEAFLDLGDAMIRMRKYAEAIEYYEIAVQYGSRNENVIGILEENYRQTGDQIKLNSLRDMIGE